MSTVTIPTEYDLIAWKEKGEHKIMLVHPDWHSAPVAYSKASAALGKIACEQRPDDFPTEGVFQMWFIYQHFKNMARKRNDGGQSYPVASETP